MAIPLRVLILEDRPADAELAMHELHQAGFDLDWQHVDTEADFLARLNPPPDIILADYSLPLWDAPGALRALQKSGLDIPFIMMSGTVGEDIAVECLKQGAHDYLLKDRLARLGPAVIKALEDKRLRDEKRRSEIALRESEERHRLLFDNASLGIGYYTPQGQVIAFNKVAAAHMGGEPENYAGKTLVELYGEEAGAWYLERIKIATESEGSQDYENFVPLPGGDKWFLSTYVRITDASGQAVGVQIISNDITKRKQAEEALRKINRSYRTLSKCNGVLVHAESELRLLQDICRTIVEVGGYQMAWVGFAGQDEARTVRPMAYAGHEAGYLDTVKITWDDSELGRGPTGTAIRTGKRVTVRHIPTDPDYEPWRVEAVKRGYASCISLPLVIADQVIGALVIYAEEPDAFDRQELDLLAELAGDLAFGIQTLRTREERARAQEALARERNLLRTLIDNLPDFIYVKDTEGRFILANEADALNMGVKSVGEVVGKTDFDYFPQELAERFYADDLLVIQSGQPLINREEPNIDSEGHPHWLLTTKVPLRDDQGNVIGLVGIGHDITERKRMEVAEYEQRILAEALAETASILNSSLNLDEVMARILENVGRVVPHDAANIQIIDQEGFSQIIACQGYETVGLSQERMLRLRFPVDTSHNLQEMRETRQPFVVSDTREYPGWMDVPETRWVRSYLGAPIFVNEETIGFINLDSANPEFFTPAHAAKLQAFADQAASAIQNARLYQDLEAERNLLEQRVTERTAQLNHVKERIEAILNSSSDVMILCQVDGSIEQVNPAFETAFRCKSEDAYNQPLTMLAAPEYVATIEQAFATVIETRQPQRVEIIVQCKHITSFDADIVLSPIIEPGDQPLGIVCSLRDISERKQMETRLRQMLEHEMELSELKSRYVAMAAHDLRNPLAAIQSTIDLIHHYRDHLTEEKVEAKFKNIHSSIKVMVEMLDDILTLGKVESGKLSFEPDYLDMVAFCENIVTEIKQVTGTSQHIDFIIKGDRPTAVVDAKLLRHILSNLLSNALKYSPEDRPVTFAVHCEPGHTLFRVQDQGIGIPEEDQKRLFETFHRASNAKQIPGTGLGLAIVKQSVDLHGGTITFESQEGVGTTFTVSIPRMIQGETNHDENPGN